MHFWMDVNWEEKYEKNAEESGMPHATEWDRIRAKSHISSSRKTTEYTQHTTTTTKMHSYGGIVKLIRQMYDQNNSIIIRVFSSHWRFCVYALSFAFIWCHAQFAPRGFCLSL